MEDHKDNDWTDLVCGVTEGKFFDLKGNKCKYMVSSATKVSGGLSGSTTKNGVTYTPQWWKDCTVVTDSFRGN